MHERIKLLNDKEVYVSIWNGEEFEESVGIKVAMNGNAVMRLNGSSNTAVYDDGGRAAIRDCFNCLDATGSFAALSDESAVPFVGKRAKYLGHDVKVIEVGGNDMVRLRYATDECDSPGRSFTASRASLLPLTPPAPKYRPYSPVEAAAHLGRLSTHVGGIGERVVSVGLTSVTLNSNLMNQSIGYQFFCDRYTWADNGTPCGVIEEPT